MIANGVADVMERNINSPEQTGLRQIDGLRDHKKPPCFSIALAYIGAVPIAARGGRVNWRGPHQSQAYSRSNGQGLVVKFLMFDEGMGDLGGNALHTLQIASAAIDCATQSNGRPVVGK